MAVRQVDASFQNDGNYCQLDLQNVSGKGPVMRIETFRCSQPKGDFGVTRAGTGVMSLAGKDHLSDASNRVFRHVYSTGVLPNPKITLEMRENFEPDGSFEIRVRDVDPESSRFGSILISRVKPRPRNEYQIYYEIRVPVRKVSKKLLTSPLKEGVVDQISGLADIASDPEELGKLDESLPGNPLEGVISWAGPKPEIAKVFEAFERIFLTNDFSTWAANVVNYERMGDFRDKCVHDCTNLTGSNPELASEFHLVRAYRASLITLGRVVDPDMYRHTMSGHSFLKAKNPLAVDPKPGVYTVFLSAYLNNIEMYQLGLDKVHSDYGGIPMKLAPGSRLENGATPVVDSTRFNRSLAELAFAFFIGPDVPALTALMEGKR